MVTCNSQRIFSWTGCDLYSYGDLINRSSCSDQGGAEVALWWWFINGMVPVMPSPGNHVKIYIRDTWKALTGPTLGAYSMFYPSNGRSAGLEKSLFITSTIRDSVISFGFSNDIWTRLQQGSIWMAGFKGRLRNYSGRACNISYLFHSQSRVPTKNSERFKPLFDQYHRHRGQEWSPVMDKTCHAGLSRQGSQRAPYLVCAGPKMYKVDRS